MFVNRTAEVRLTNCTVSDNIASASSYGGAGLYVDGVAKLDHCTVSNNRAYFNGGGIYVTLYGNVQLRNTILAANLSDGAGPDCWGNASPSRLPSTETVL